MYVCVRVLYVYLYERERERKREESIDGNRHGVCFILGIGVCLTRTIPQRKS